MPALIFDYDGLLADTEALVGEVLVDLLAQRGVTTGFETMVSFMGSTGPVNDAAWSAQVAAWLGPDGDAQGLQVEAWEIIEARRHTVPLCDGVVELLDAAEALGWPAAIGTGARRSHLDHHLGFAGVLDRFAEVVTASEVAHGKPEPDIYLEVARRLGVPPRECVVFEDSLPGYRAGVAAGMAVVVCPCAITRYSIFPPDARVVQSLRDVHLDELGIA